LLNTKFAEFLFSTHHAEQRCLDCGCPLAHPAFREGDRGDDAVVDTFLTLIIALGGISTGIGAIWAALAARRQAQLTEQSLAQTERSLAEQNERARLNLSVDLLFRYSDRFESQLFLSRRRAAAKYLLDSVFMGEDMVEVAHLNRAAWDVCHFFEELGQLQSVEAIPVEAVWNTLGSVIRTYWPLCKPAIEKLRKE
jgi:hypothetical protein